MTDSNGGRSLLDYAIYGVVLGVLLAFASLLLADAWRYASGF